MIGAVVEHNVARHHASSKPVATIKDVHSGPNAAKASAEDAGGLEPILWIACEIGLMLTSNFWVGQWCHGYGSAHLLSHWWRTTSPPNCSDCKIWSLILWWDYSHPFSPPHQVCIWWFMFSAVATSQASLGCYDLQVSTPHFRLSGNKHWVHHRIEICCLLSCSSFEGPSLWSSISLPTSGQSG